MWFAFKYCSFEYCKYYLERARLVEISCDLLSNIVLLNTVNTKKNESTNPHQLWFAFKYCSFEYCKYWIIAALSLSSGCDLLSNIVLLNTVNTPTFN